MIESESQLIVYIDQNKLIDLARLKLCSDDCGEKNAYTLLCDLIDKYNVVIPLSLTHIIETTKISNIDRRRSFVEFLVQISKGYCFTSLDMLQRYEVLHAVRTWAGKTNEIHIGISPNISTYSGVIGKGILNVFGQFLAIDKIPMEHKWVVDYFNSTDAVVNFVMRMHDTEALEWTQSMENNLINEIEPIRDIFWKYSKEKTFDAQFIGFIQQFVVPLINDACCKFGIMPKELFDTLDTWDKVKQFFLNIPFVDITVRLLHELFRQKDRRLDKNDQRDILFLIAAVPYSDIIISEKYWVHTIKKLKMDKKYNTAVFTSIDDAIDLMNKQTNEIQ